MFSRKFGRVQFHAGSEAPAWWTQIAPAVTSPDFTLEAQSATYAAEVRAQQASDVAVRHAAALDAVSQTSRELAALAERLQQSIARFSVTRNEGSSVRADDTPPAPPAPAYSPVPLLGTRLTQGRPTVALPAGTIGAQRKGS